MFLVDDSPLALVMLKRMLATAPDIFVVGTARDGNEALARLPYAQPDVICTDYIMPGLDGLGLIERAMAEFPRPILVISSAINSQERDKTFPLLAAGAIDVFAKPDAQTDFSQGAAELCQKIRLLSGIVVISRRARSQTPATPSLSAPNPLPSAPFLVPLPPSPHAPTVNLNAPIHASLHTVSTQVSASTPTSISTPAIRVVAIGASTGGPQVLHNLLGRFPAAFPCPILCVQHISAGFLQGLVEWLDAACRVRVVVAQGGEMAQAGTVYFPPENAHLEIDARGRLLASDAPAVDGHKPSATVMLEAAARAYGRQALGVVLTGMGSDGAAGLEALRRAGGTTFAQDEASCVVFGMPKQAIARGAAQHILPPDAIADAILRLAPGARM